MVQVGLRQTPRVSVVIPAYNTARFMRETLASVFAQTYQPFEVIVVNDGSPDTPELEAAIEPWWGQLVYLTQPNGGPSRARNTGIDHARGPYVAFLDSDDVWLPQFLSEQMRVLDRDPRLDLVYSNGLIAGDYTELTGRELMELSPSRGPVTFESLVSETCTVLTTCTVARRSAVVAAGGFDERFRRSEDFHLWLNLAFRGHRIAYNRRVLARHRLRAGSLADDHAAMRQAFIDVLCDLDRRLPLTPAQRCLVARQIALKRSELALEAGKDHLLGGDFAAAATALRRACALEPRRLRQVRLRAVHVALAMAPRLLRRVYGSLRPSRSAASLTTASR